MFFSPNDFSRARSLLRVSQATAAAFEIASQEVQAVA